MLLRFGVSNHLSIRDLQELSFVASSLKDRDDGLIDCAVAPSGSILPAVVIYGANASGKSNLVDAMAAMREMVLRSHTKGEPGGGVQCNPFRLEGDYSQKPSRFEIDFVLDGVRHHYGFEASEKAFVSERLYVFPKSHRRTLFEREGGEFRFGRELSGLNNLIAKLTRPNSLYLSAAAQNDHKQLSRVFEYFRSIQGIRGISVPGKMASSQLPEEGPDRRVIDFLGKVGTGVVDFQRKETETPEEIRTIEREISDVLNKHGHKHKLIATEISSIELAHRSRDGGEVYLELDRESAGTRRLLVLLDRAFRALDEGALLCIDELDAGLHTQAAEAVLQLFCSPQTNSNGAQLLATTHDTNLMKSSVLRRDQLWFTQKDVWGATEIYPLTDIRTRQGDNLAKGYLQGRYGATPFEHPISASGETK